MFELRRIGRFFPLSPEGHIVNDCEQRFVDPRLAAMVRDFYVQQFGDKLHSVYVRGSLPRGNFIPNVSDLDTFGVVDIEDVPKTVAGAPAAARNILDVFPEFTDIVLVVVSLKTVLSERRNPFTFLLQTQSLCIHGPSLHGRLQPYRPDLEIIGEALYLRERIEKYHIDIADIDDDHSIKLQCSVLMKGIVRASYDLVMHRVGLYTRDLYHCYERFSHYYPTKEKQALQGLQWAVEPVAHKPLIAAFLSDFGGWLCAAVDELVRSQGQLPGPESPLPPAGTDGP